MQFLTSLEASAFSQWVLTSMLGFPTLIALHSVGMAVAVGLSFVVTLRLNKVFTGFRGQLVSRFLDIAVWGFTLNFLTGMALFVARGPDYIASVIFLIKMLLVVTSAIILIWLKRHLMVYELTTESSGAGRLARNMSLIATATWFGAVITGRLIAYLSYLY